VDADCAFVFVSWRATDCATTGVLAAFSGLHVSSPDGGEMRAPAVRLTAPSAPFSAGFGSEASHPVGRLWENGRCEQQILYEDDRKKSKGKSKSGFFVASLLRMTTLWVMTKLWAGG
jgi:hypothetical protein